MYARVVTAQIRPGTLDEAKQFLRDQVVPTYKQQKGHTHLLFLTNATENKVLTISLWETEADLKAGVYHQHLHAQVGHLGTFSTQSYEVAIEKMPQGQLPRHTRVMSGHTQPSQLDEAIRLVHEEFLPAFKTQKGFHGLLFLVDASNNHCMSISFWETEAYMKAHETSGHHGQQLAKGHHLMVAPEQIIQEREYYEVALLA